MNIVPKTVAAASTWMASTIGIALTDVRIHSAGAEAWMLCMRLGRSTAGSQACSEREPHTSLSYAMARPRKMTATHSTTMNTDAALAVRENCAGAATVAFLSEWP